jgi:hypothetical protein
MFSQAKIAFVLVVLGWTAGCVAPVSLDADKFNVDRAAYAGLLVMTPSSLPGVKVDNVFDALTPRSAALMQDMPAVVVQTNVLPNAFLITWLIQPGVSEYALYSKFDLQGTNDWYWIGSVTNTQSASVAMKRASGLAITNEFFTVRAFSSN